MKSITYILYVAFISIVLLEIALRVAAQTDPYTGAEYLLGKSHRYLLPFPIRDDVSPEVVVEEGAYRMFSPSLGWTHAPWGEEEHIYFSNDEGWRITYDDFAAREEAPDTVDYLFIGNSFTHGDPVLAERTWPHLFSHMRNSSYANIAVGGYGIDQALMRWMEQDVHADTVFFGVVSGDLERAFDPVYNAYRANNKTKPRFIFSDDGFRIINYPVLTPYEFEQAKTNPEDAEIFKYMHGYTPYFYGSTYWSWSYLMRTIVSLQHRAKYNTDEFCYLGNRKDDLDYCMDIFTLFNAYCKEKNAHGVIVLLDNGLTFYDRENKTNGQNPWLVLSAELAQRGITHIDFHEGMYVAFKENRGNIIHPTEGLHYSDTGHRMVKDLLHRYFQNTTHD